MDGKTVCLITPTSQNQAGRGPRWQRGYGAFSVCKSTLESVARYIRNQEAHHRKMNYEQEFITLLEKHGVAYDPEDIFR